jgi:hypothetical protein
MDFRMPELMDIVHRPEFYVTINYNVSEPTEQAPPCPLLKTETDAVS